MGLLFGYSALRGQCGIPENFIHNCGFEHLHPDAPAGSPNGHSQVYLLGPGSAVRYTTEWEARTYDTEEGSATTCDWIGKVHSPDWFRDGQFNHVDGSAYSGLHFIGMGDYELIQQKFHDDYELEDGQFYKLRLYVKLVSHGPLGFQWTSNWQGSKINVYLATKSINYKEENECLEVCTQRFVDHEDGLLQNIDLLHSFFPLNWTNYPLTGGQAGWHALEYTFQANGMDNFDWLAIELVNENYTEPATLPSESCFRNYILVDEVSLAPACSIGCADACSQTDGPMQPQSNNVVLWNEPFKIWNIANAANATFQVYNNAIGQTLLYEKIYQCTNGLQDEIRWDGRKNNGATLASGIYFWRLYLNNDCGSFSCRFDGPVEVISIPSMVNTAIDCYQGPIRVPEPCCEQTIYLDNITFDAPYIWEWQAVGDIKGATQGGSSLIVNSGATVIFKAGQSVILGSGTVLQAGSTVRAVLESCN